MASPAELCSPWIGPPDCAGTSDLAERELAALIASQMLYVMTGYRYPGVCTDTIVSCGGCCPGGQWLDYPVSGARPLGGFPSCSAGCPPVVPCVDGAYAITLPGRPVIDVPAASIDGVALTGDVVIQDDSHVIVSGQPWGDSWSITYRYGSAPPAYLQRAAEVLACEIVSAACVGDDCPPCRLPEGVTQLTREGVSMSMLDPVDFLEQGGFGVYVVDAAIASANRNRETGARVLTAAALACPPFRRLRTVTIGAGPVDPDFPGAGDEISGGTPDDPGIHEFSGGTPDDTGTDEFSGGTP